MPARFSPVLDLSLIHILLSVLNGFGDFAKSMSSAFDADLTVAPREGQTFASAEIDSLALTRVKGVGVVSVLILNAPYLLFVYLFDKVGQAVRLSPEMCIRDRLHTHRHRKTPYQGERQGKGARGGTRKVRHPLGCI